MIKNRKDYISFLKRDKIALGINLDTLFSKIQNILMPDGIWTFQKKLRKLEYFRNCKKEKNIFWTIYYFYLKYKFLKLSRKLGFEIPENVFGPGLAIIHPGTIVVNNRARVGANCRIHACTNIGASGGDSRAPTIGNNVYIGPGAKIYGDIIIGNNIAIAANAAVGKSFEKDNIMIAGVPGKEIKEIDIKLIIKHL